MQTTIAPSWSWPGADPAMLDAIHEGALEGLKAVPVSAGEVVSAEFFGRSRMVTNARGGSRHSSPDPVVKVVLRAPEGERTIEVLIDPGPLGADTPAEAREYVASAVLAVVSERPTKTAFDEDDPDSLAAGWGFRTMQELTQITANPDPVLSSDQLRARVRTLYGEHAEAHERDGTPTGKELAEEVRQLVREAKRAGLDLYDIVKDQVTDAQADRLDGILARALEVQEAENALKSLGQGE